MQSFEFGSHNYLLSSGSESNYGISLSDQASSSLPFTNEPKQMISDHQYKPFPHPQPADADLSQICQPHHQSHHKKPHRACQACNMCRTRKAKCDEAWPCSHCKDNNLTCTYKAPPPPKQDRHTLFLEAQLDILEYKIGHARREIGNIQQTIGRNQQETNNMLDILLQLHECPSKTANVWWERQGAS